MNAIVLTVFIGFVLVNFFIFLFGWRLASASAVKVSIQSLLEQGAYWLWADEDEAPAAVEPRQGAAERPLGLAPASRPRGRCCRGRRWTR